MHEFYGDVIYRFTREDAINQGVLIDLALRYPEECRLYKYPVACTTSVWALVEMATADQKHCNSHAGVIFDILYMSQRGIFARPDEQTVLFAVIITGTGNKRKHKLKAICHAGDNLEPVITIMLPDED